MRPLNEREAKRCSAIAERPNCRFAANGSGAGWRRLSLEMARPRREIAMVRCAASTVLAAIEIYNKPTAEYREQTFALLMANAWETLLKARLVQQSGGKENVIYRRKQGSRRYEFQAPTNR